MRNSHGRTLLRRRVDGSRPSLAAAPAAPGRASLRAARYPGGVDQRLDRARGWSRPGRPSRRAPRARRRRPCWRRSASCGSSARPSGPTAPPRPRRARPRRRAPGRAPPPSGSGSARSGRRARARAGSMVSLSSATIILLPSYSCSCSRPEGTFSSEATSRIAKPASRSSSAALRTAQAAFLDSFSSFASIAMRPFGGARGGVDLDHDVALLAAAGGALVADVVRDVAARGGHLLDQLEGVLLELAALAGAALALGGQLEPRPRARRAAASPRPRAGRSSRSAARCASPERFTSCTTDALKSASGLCPSWAENWRSRSWRESLSDFATSSFTWCCTAVLRSSAEVLRDQLGELLGLGVEQLRHRAAVLAEEALELLHEALLDRPRPIREGALGLRGRMLRARGGPPRPRRRWPRGRARARRSRARR